MLQFIAQGLFFRLTLWNLQISENFLWNWIIVLTAMQSPILDPMTSHRHTSASHQSLKAQKQLTCNYTPTTPHTTCLNFSFFAGFSLPSAFLLQIMALWSKNELQSTLEICQGKIFHLKVWWERKKEKGRSHIIITSHHNELKISPRDEFFSKKWEEEAEKSGSWRENLFHSLSDYERGSNP